MCPECRAKSCTVCGAEMEGWDEGKKVCWFCVESAVGDAFPSDKSLDVACLVSHNSKSFLAIKVGLNGKLLLDETEKGVAGE